MCLHTSSLVRDGASESGTGVFTTGVTTADLKPALVLSREALVACGISLYT